MQQPSPLEILFVAPYPPRRGGTAHSLLQLTIALQQRGHSVRVLAPITPDTAGFDESFVPALGNVRLTRYVVPYFLYVYVTIPFDEHYRACEREAIRNVLPNLIGRERPDIVILGDGPLREEMERACRSHHVEDRFRFPGWVPYARVPDFLNLADIVVQPSEGEGLSRIYLESMACGRLLLASDIPPAREVVQDGETGLLFRTADVHDLSAKTLAAAGDATLRAAVGEKARQRVASHCLGRAAIEYERLFHTVIHRTGHTAGTRAEEQRGCGHHDGGNRRSAQHATARRRNFVATPT